MRKLKKLRIDQMDCVEDNEYVGVFVGAVLDYSRHETVKKLLSWPEFMSVVKRKLVTLCLYTWDGREYEIDAILNHPHRDKEDEKEDVYYFDVKIQQIKAFNLQMHANGWQIDKETNLGKFSGLLTIHANYLLPKKYWTD